jgi:NTP pyrophosphatase (non-canonical NTP hydrolase)
MITEKVIKLPRLSLLSPTMDSTLLKIMEEAGELARAVLVFIEDKTNSENLMAVSQELLDVAQTCVTMIFVLEDTYNIDPGKMIDIHLAKLVKKGYLFDTNVRYYVESKETYKYMFLPKLNIPNVTLLKTVCKIQEEIGELTQKLGKGTGKSGERPYLKDMKTVLTEGTLELLDIAQCCFTMLYILEDKYQIEIDKLVTDHIQKLQRKGYCKISSELLYDLHLKDLR